MDIELEESAVTKVHRAFKLAEEAQASDFDRLKRLYSHYRCTSNQDSYRIATRSQYVVPVIYKTVETILPRVVSVLFSAHPPIQSRYRIMPADEAAPKRLRAVDELFEYIFDKKKLFWTVQAWIKESLIFGQSYLKVGWRHKKRTYMKKVFNVETLEQEEKPEQKIVEDFLDIQLVDIFDMFFSPEAKFPDPFDCKWVIHRSKKRKSQVLALRDAGVYEDFRDDELKGSNLTDDPKALRNTIMGRGSSPQPESDDPMITVYEYWEDERVITTAEHSILLRDEPNPFGLEGKPKRKPFIACCDNLVPNMLFQIGEAEPLEHTQIERSTLRRQRTDNNSLIINKMWLYNKDAEVDTEAMRLARPGGGVGARPMDGNLANAVQPIQQGDINGASYREDQELDKDSQEISGLLDYAVGSAPERRETATTVQLLQTAANLRFDIKIRNYVQSFTDLGYMVLERCKQFLTTPIPLRIPIPGQLGMDYVQIDKEAIPDIDFLDLVAPGSPGLLMKDARQQKLLQYYTAIMQNPTANPQAALLLLVRALKEAEVDGIEPVLQLLEKPVMPMAPPQGGANGAKPAAPPSPPTTPPISAGVNENPTIVTGPRPER